MNRLLLSTAIFVLSSVGMVLAAQAENRVNYPIPVHPNPFRSAYEITVDEGRGVIKHGSIVHKGSGPRVTGKGDYEHGKRG